MHCIQGQKLVSVLFVAVLIILFLFKNISYYLLIILFLLYNFSLPVCTIFTYTNFQSGMKYVIHIVHYEMMLVRLAHSYMICGEELTTKISTKTLLIHK